MKRRIVLIAVLALFLLSGYYVYANWFNHEPLPDGLLQANGRIEGDYLTISSKFPGRVVERRVREGDGVTRGQVLVRLDDKQVQAKVEQAVQAVAACDARINAARAMVESLGAQIKAAETSLGVLRKETPLAIAIAEAELSHATAMAASSDSREGKARRDFERSQQLFEAKATSEDELEDSQLAWTHARNELTTAAAAVTKATEQLAGVRLGPDRIKSKEDELAALMAQKSEALAVVAECIATKAQAEAALEGERSVLDDLTISAPSEGMIMARFADHGEVVGAGAPLFELVDLDQLYLKVYVPEILIGKVRLGLKARVYVDAYPEKHFDSTVRYISSRAEFTPKEVQTPDERVKLVFGVKLYLDENPNHSLAPGLPADAVIRWKDDAKWAKPRW